MRNCNYDYHNGCTANWSPYEDQFKVEIHDRAKEIDEQDRLEWHSLALGWAIGKGLSPDEAWKFSMHIRYHTDLG